MCRGSSRHPGPRRRHRYRLTTSRTRLLRPIRENPCPSSSPSSSSSSPGPTTSFAVGPAPRPWDYARPELDGSGPAAADIPLDGTKPGASLDVWPPHTRWLPQPLSDGVPDLRGLEVVDGRMKGHVERIEQAATASPSRSAASSTTASMGPSRTVSTTSPAHGDRIRVAATFEDGVHKLRPFGRKVVAVTRRLDGDELVWRYGPFRNRLRRLAGPPLDHPATRAAAEAAGPLPD